MRPICTYLLFAMALFGCDEIIAGVGEPCMTSDDCVDDTACYEQSGGVPLCMQTCTDDTRLCDVTGEVCVGAPSEPSLFVCYLGGTIEIGAPCSNSGECELGAVCVEGGVAGGSVCEAACDMRDDNDCSRDQTCLELTFPGGYCAPTPEA